MGMAPTQSKKAMNRSQRRKFLRDQEKARKRGEKRPPKVKKPKLSEHMTVNEAVEEIEKNQKPEIFL